MKHLLQKEFDLDILEIKKLNGYENVNFQIIGNKNSYVFKTYTYSDKLLEWVQAENQILLNLSSTNTGPYPKPVPFADGSYIKTLPIDGKQQICRLLTFLEGEFLGNLEHTEALFKSLGLFLANMDLELQGQTNHVIAAKEWAWDTQHLHLNQQFIDDIPRAKDRALVSYFIQQYKEVVYPVRLHLRKQLIHNDANEWNVLTQNGVVSSMIDFGDLAHSYLINELGVAIAYACYDKDSPLEWASIIIKAYHSKLPLQELEINVLYYMIAARLSISVCNSAHSRKIDPYNSYATSSEKSAWAMLYRWLKIGPVAAENSFRKAAGFPLKKSPPIQKLIHRRHQHLSPVLSLSYEQPIHMDRSAFQYMYDTSGNTYLDAYNNIPHVGHSHPQIVAAGQQQMARLNTNTRYLYEQLPAYAEKLLSKFPDPLQYVFFVNSGSAASDLAVRMAKIHTGYQKVMVMEHGYHGHTQTALEISDYKFNHPNGQGQMDYILKATLPNTFGGKYRNNDGSAGKSYGLDAIAEILKSDAPLAAFISEPIVGCGGQVPLAKGYLKEVYPAIRGQGGVCISDEVQTGFGRTGNHFWGFQTQDVIPDIVIIGKPMANGHPMGAVVCTREIASSFGKGVEFFSSFGGNPVSCAIASSVLDVIEEEKLQDNAKTVGDYYKNRLKDLQQKYDCIGDVRGSGLFLGVEFIKDQHLTPDPTLAHHLKNQLRQHKILLSTDGPFNNVIKSKPPLCFTSADAELVVQKMDFLLGEYFAKKNAF